MEVVMTNEIRVFILAISFCYSQCDTNNDGYLDIMDVVIQINCVLADCWEIDIDDDEVYYDDYTYQTIWINDQHWMAENLRATHYQNGDIITNIVRILSFIEIC